MFEKNENSVLNKSGVVRSVDRALLILELFSLDKPEWGVTEISRQISAPKSHVHALLNTLQHRGFVVKNKSSGKYTLGIRLFELGSTVIEHLDMRKVALPYMEQLNAEFNETVHLGMLSEGEVLSIEQEEANRALHHRVLIGRRAPLHCTAVGKAILAFLPQKEIIRIISEKGLQRFTPATITAEDKLLEELELVRSRGYAVDRQEHDEGVICIAAPILNYRGIAGSMSVSGPASRIDEETVLRIAPQIKEYCRLISQHLGLQSMIQKAPDDRG